MIRLIKLDDRWWFKSPKCSICIGNKTNLTKELIQKVYSML